MNLALIYGQITCHSIQCIRERFQFIAITERHSKRLKLVAGTVLELLDESPITHTKRSDHMSLKPSFCSYRTECVVHAPARRQRNVADSLFPMLRTWFHYKGFSGGQNGRSSHLTHQNTKSGHLCSALLLCYTGVSRGSDSENPEMTGYKNGDLKKRVPSCQYLQRHGYQLIGVI